MSRGLALVTGATGNLGAPVVDALLARGIPCQPLCVTRPQPRPDARPSRSALN